MRPTSQNPSRGTKMIISGMGRTRSQKPKCAFQKGVPILMILVQNLILLRFVHNRAQPRVAMCLRVG